MYYQNYEEYMRNVLGYPTEASNTYEMYNYGTMPYENPVYATIDNNGDLINLYPEIYKIINPMVCKICESNTKTITRELVDQMTEEIYLNIENATSVYALSTVIGHSFYKMHQSGISADVLSDLAFNTVMLMTANTDFKDFLTITQYLLDSMAEAGRITPEQLSMGSTILSETGINPSPVVSSILLEFPSAQ